MEIAYYNYKILFESAWILRSKVATSSAFSRCSRREVSLTNIKLSKRCKRIKLGSHFHFWIRQPISSRLSRRIRDEINHWVWIIVSTYGSIVNRIISIRHRLLWRPKTNYHNFNKLVSTKLYQISYWRNHSVSRWSRTRRTLPYHHERSPRAFKKLHRTLLQQRRSVHQQKLKISWRDWSRTSFTTYL